MSENNWDQYKVKNNNPDVGQNVNTFLGEMKRPDLKRMMSPDMIDEAIKAAGAGPEMKIIGAPKTALELLPSAFKRVDPRELVESVRKKHDFMHKHASDIYNLIKERVKERGVPAIKLGDEIIEKSKEYLPKTDRVKSLINNAKNGAYEAVHDLQSELFKKGRAYKGSKLPSDQNLGEEIFELRDKINKSIANHFDEYGHNDLSKLLEEGRGIYKNLKDTYYSHPRITKMVDQAIRLMPKNPMTVFSEESKPMSKILESHPEIKETLNILDDRNQLSNILKNSVKGASALALGTGAIQIPNILSSLLSGGK